MTTTAMGSIRARAQAEEAGYIIEGEPSLPRCVWGGRGVARSGKRSEARRKRGEGEAKRGAKRSESEAKRGESDARER